VREIKNAIENAAVLATRDTIGPESFADLPVRGQRSAEPQGAPHDGIHVPLGTPLADAERQIILANLRRFQSRSETARALGLGLRTLYTRLREYGAELRNG
jgi:DNA-binding NtrC family response regulator